MSLTLSNFSASTAAALRIRSPAFFSADAEPCGPLRSSLLTLSPCYSRPGSACYPSLFGRASSAKTRGFHTQLDEGPSNLKTELNLGKETTLDNARDQLPAPRGATPRYSPRGTPEAVRTTSRFPEPPHPRKPPPPEPPPSSLPTPARWLACRVLAHVRVTFACNHLDPSGVSSCSHQLTTALSLNLLYFLFT